ncbi:MAG: DUF2608 domain-containing protein [Parachlamydiaceae bacterium]
MHKILIALFILCSVSLFGEVVHAPNLDAIQSKIGQLDEQALVVFDVDFTLIIPKDQILQPAGEAYYQIFLTKLRAMKEEGARLGSIIALQAEVALVNPCSLTLLDQLKDRQIKTITLTAMPTGRFGTFESAEDWRFKQLKDLGIDLSWSFPEKPYIEFNSLDPSKANPVFKKGILASAKHPKGQVLAAFLNQLNLKPSHVIFIDDRMEYIHSVEAELDKAGIPHTSFHYTEALDASQTFDKALADFQLDYLLQHGTWLNDAQAEAILNR